MVLGAYRSRSSSDAGRSAGDDDVFAALDQQAAFDSAGFVLAEGVLELDVGDRDCYDYYVMDRFDAAVTHGTRFVSGPLIVDNTLLEIAVPTVLVNAGRRVIVSNDSQWTTGEKLRTAPNPGEHPWRCVVPVTEDLGWVLATADRSERTTKEST